MQQWQERSSCQEEARQEGEEGRALNVTGEDNHCSASCPTPVTMETKLLTANEEDGMLYYTMLSLLS